MENGTAANPLRARVVALLMACSAAWAVQFHYGLTAADRGQGVVDLLLVAGLYLLLRAALRVQAERTVRVRAGVLSALFVLLLAVGGDWLTHMRYDSFTNVPLYVAYYLNAFLGTFLLFNAALRALLSFAMKADPFTDAQPACKTARKIFFGAFALCAAVYFLFLLNQYPGAMESDHMRQLKALLSGVFENRNPLVNSLLVYGCVSLVTALGGSMNAGVFLYSVVQLLFLAAVFAYAVSLLYRARYRKGIVLGALLFYALVPYNIFYSYGMWKDSFFAGWLMLTVLKAWSLLIRRQEGRAVRLLDYVLLFCSALMASLARNSGWSALIVFAPCLMLLKAEKPIRRRAALGVFAGVALALVLVGPVFGALGVTPTADSITPICVPLQQVGLVIKEEKALSDEEAALLDAVVDRAQVKETFDPYVADPMKDALYPRIDAFDTNKGAYVRLWLSLGARYPLTYFRAYKDLLRMYYDPDLSSETAYKWVYANDFGVYRDPKLLPALDLGYYEQWLELPVLNLFKRPGAILWCMLICWQLCALTGRRRMRVFFVPLLMVYAGLFLTAPVALFRYVYSAVACLPLYLAWPYFGESAQRSE